MPLTVGAHCLGVCCWVQQPYLHGGCTWRTLGEHDELSCAGGGRGEEVCPSWLGRPGSFTLVLSGCGLL